MDKNCCKDCLNKKVCKDIVYYDAVEACPEFLGWVSVEEERPPVLKDCFMLDCVGNMFVGYYCADDVEEYFVDTRTLEHLMEMPSYWLKGNDVYKKSDEITDELFTEV